MIEVELLQPEDELEYKEFLISCDYSMAQHTLGWQNVVKNLLGDKFYYLIAKENGKIVGGLPISIKENERGNIMNSIPFAGGYGGIIAQNNIRNREMIYEALLHEMISNAKENDCILISISTPPFSKDLNLYNALFKPDYILPNFIQYIDLGNPVNYERDIRRKIKKAVELGVEITEDDSSGNLQVFYDIYKTRVRQLNGKMYPPRFFEVVKKNANANSKFLFARYQGKIVSGILLLHSRRIVDDFIAVMDMDYSYTEANSLMIDCAINWARKKGFKYWNWQSLPSKDSGGYNFKARWGSLDSEHYYLTKVLGDLTALKKCGLEQIKKEYEWYFVMPYDQLGSKND
jgi:hypothetical protein